MDDESSSDILFTYASEVRNCTRRVMLQELRTECAIVDAQLPSSEELPNMGSGDAYCLNVGLPLQDPGFDTFASSLLTGEKQAELNELRRIELQQEMKLNNYLNLAQRAGMAFEHISMLPIKTSQVVEHNDLQEAERCTELLDEIDELSEQVKSRMLGRADSFDQPENAERGCEMLLADL